MNEKTCYDCRHTRREQTGPHAWLHDCALQQRDYPDAEHCAFYHPGAAPYPENERWPCRETAVCPS